MNISLPAPLKEWVETQIRLGGYGTASEFFRQLLGEEQKRRARLAVEAQLADALDSGEPVPVTAATWRESQRRVEERLKAAPKKPRTHAKHR